MENQIKISLYEKIQLISDEIKSIEKDMTVGTGSYSYKAVSDLMVTKKVKEAEQKFKVVSIPIKQELVSHEVIRTVVKETEKITYSFIIKMIVVFVNLEDTNEKIEVESYGHGLDSGDKGFGKASTYARKYALLNAYKIATGEDPDADASKGETTEKKPSEKRLSVTNYLVQDVKIMNSTLQHFNLGRIDDASDKQIEIMYSNLKQKGKL
jgi:hypothetical protein